MVAYLREMLLFINMQKYIVLIIIRLIHCKLRTRVFNKKVKGNKE